MAITEGARVPDVSESVFAVPGAFTPGCSNTRAPGVDASSAENVLSNL